ncbi:MAG: hypothetical protein L7F77_03760 [Candidatus Magnetominusculus sp. LBB02]|nr:hypothetical protein [Candidatus Magnetominusculus sp. LBB02]
MAICGTSTVTVDGKAFIVAIRTDAATSGFNVECSELGVVSQGKTVKGSLMAIAEAIEKHLRSASG